MLSSRCGGSHLSFPTQKMQRQENKKVVDRLHYTRPCKQARFRKENINVTFSKMKIKFNISWLKST